MTASLVSRRHALVLVSSAALASPAAAVPPVENWSLLAQDVRSEFQWAWRGYVAKAWGKDEINPVSGTSRSFFIEGHDLGLSLVEALDTLWIMGLDAEFQAGVDWVKTHLDFDVDGNAQVFETNIRLVGGLLSAHLACGDPVLLAKARDLADRLVKAFEASPHGLPWRYVNLRTGAVSDPETNLAEIGTYLSEFGVLSQLTGDRRYFDMAKRAMRHALDRRSKIGLMAANIHATTGEFTSRNASIDVYADSFYEYLWDAWELFGDQDCKRWAVECVDAQLAHQAKRYDGRLWFPMVDFETGAVTGTAQSELAAYYAGLLGQVGRKAQGDDYLASFSELQATFGVIPESIDVTTRQPRRKHTGLRPEYPDACLNLWLEGRDDRYRRLAGAHYVQMKATSRAAFGYTALKDITTKPMTQGDNCPGYWWSEQMKYYYLLFSDTPRIDYGRLQLSTEANVLRGFRKG
ncbi:alpha-mannosidase [Caulobacter sp. Root655]|uniref:glycoside hydrolase family 47 protein n=1 Tax=Caulobacter sp. Root655 TaxID=1736578 RepID=UPI0006F55209|nr:glycoside hydrolase family 47 protein [Caulobacter sp. Root655]KRA61494.1 alpha-mannosidase [Caulobacter sp. Root655]